MIGLALGSLSAIARAQEPPTLPTVRVEAARVPRYSTWPDSARRAIRDSLAIGRARWRRSRPTWYLFAAISTEQMTVPVPDRNADGQLKAWRIHGDSVVGVVWQPAPQYTPAPAWTRGTVDAVFRQLEAEVASPSRQVNVLVLDSTFGFPRVWHTDDARNGYGFHVTEQGSGGAVALFRSDAPDRPCGWWRRRIGRCR